MLHVQTEEHELALLQITDSNTVSSAKLDTDSWICASMDDYGYLIQICGNMELIKKEQQVQTRKY